MSLALLLYARRLGRTPSLIGLDRDPGVIATVAGIAAETGETAATFEATAIADWTAAHPDAGVDLLVSLHACDTATDEALAAGVRLGAGAIVLAPCCHHELSTLLAEGAAAGRHRPPRHPPQPLLRPRHRRLPGGAARAARLPRRGDRVRGGGAHRAQRDDPRGAAVAAGPGGARTGPRRVRRAAAAVAIAGSGRAPARRAVDSRRAAGPAHRRRPARPRPAGRLRRGVRGRAVAQVRAAAASSAPTSPAPAPSRRAATATARRPSSRSPCRTRATCRCASPAAAAGWCGRCSTTSAPPASCRSRGTAGIEDGKQVRGRALPGAGALRPGPLAGGAERGDHRRHAAAGGDRRPAAGPDDRLRRRRRRRRLHVHRHERRAGARLADRVPGAAGRHRRAGLAAGRLDPGRPRHPGPAELAGGGRHARPPGRRRHLPGRLRGARPGRQRRARARVVRAGGDGGRRGGAGAGSRDHAVARHLHVRSPGARRPAAPHRRPAGRAGGCGDRAAGRWRPGPARPGGALRPARLGHVARPSGAGSRWPGGR